MSKEFILILFCLVSFYPVYSNVNDTIVLDEVIVTGSMPKVNLRNLPMSISVVSE